MSAQSVSNILLSVLAASAAILVVFVTLGSRVEKQVVQAQTAAVIKNLLRDAPLLGDAETPLTAYVNSLQVPDMAAQDAASAASNAALLQKAAMIVGGSVLAGLLAVRVMARQAGFSFAAALRQAAVSGLLAAGTETAFLLCVAQHFVSADPNAVRLMILQTLQQDAGP